MHRNPHFQEEVHYTMNNSTTQTSLSFQDCDHIQAAF